MDMLRVQAEPITTSAIFAFFSTFVPYGLPVTAMMPGYGLAEHTVYVSDGGTLVTLANKLELELHQRIVDVCPPIPVVDLATTSRCTVRVCACMYACSAVVLCPDIVM